ncbi:MAG: copper resistance CopC family protein [Bryobacteraceae bacterium]
MLDVPMTFDKVNHAFHKTAYVLLLAFSFAFVAFAHAILVKSTPSANAIVTGPNVPVVLTFNSKVDQTRSALTLEGPDHSASKVPIIVDRSSPARLMAKLSKMAAGPYDLRWQVLAADGHITRGEIPFRVK